MNGNPLLIYNLIGTLYADDLHTDVYVAGYAYNAAIMWKNGVATRLAGGTTQNYAEAFSVFVSGTDTYLAGTEQFQYPNDNYLAATIWKNRFTTNLTTNITTARANSVFVSGTDVYVAGKEGISGNTTSIGKVWKNGVATTLSNVTSAANSVFVSGTDVYVAGSDLAQAGQVATLWKNGVATNLSNVGGKANSVFVSGTDVYVAGIGYDGSAKVWKNGLPINLSSGPPNCVANSIYVK